MRPLIHLSPPHLGDLEKDYVLDALTSNWVAPAGPNITEFERSLGAVTGAGHVAALSSGTAALHLALVLLGVGPGDEVICQSLTFVASVNPILYQRATPVFVDSEPTTWNMCPDALEVALRARLALGKRPKAVIVVHLYGMPARMADLRTVCERYDVPIIEDAAEALGSLYRRQACGTLGKLSALSFNGNKIITTSAGGALLSNEERLIQRAQFLATQAREPVSHYEHAEVGYNYRMSNVCAGIGRGQLMVLSERVAQRRANFRFYQQTLGQQPGIGFQPEPADCRSNRWLTALLLNPTQTELTANALRLALDQQRIEARPLWKPMHQQPLFADCPVYRTGVADRLFASGLCLPSGSSLTQAEREQIAAVVVGAINR